MSKRRVVVTGLGIISPVGSTVKSAWDAVLKGESGIGPITRFDVSAFPVRFGGAVRGFDINEYISPKDARRMDEFMQYGVAAGMQAMTDSGIDMSKLDADRCGAVCGAGIGGLGTIEEEYGSYLKAGSPRKISPFFVPATIVNMISGHLSIKYGLKGPNLGIVTACTTSTHAIGLGMRTIQYGDADMIIAGGGEMATTVCGLGSFGQAKALSTRNDAPTEASRPFDKERDGFVLSDGGGAVILEELEHARKRGANIYAEVIGFGMSGDAYHITSPPEDGEGARLAMANAIKDAAINPSDVQYLNAHATSTSLGDRAETIAMKRAFGDHAKRLAVSSTKSMTGHLLGAAGVVEAIFSILAIRDQVAPATINYRTPDPDCDLDYVPNTARQMKIETALSNSFGFGGTNGSLIFRRFKRLKTGSRLKQVVRELGVPPTVLRRLAALLPARYPMLLDSAADGPLSRTSVLLAEPRAALWLDADGRLGADGTVIQGNTFFAALENWWLAEREATVESRPADLPFAGGWAIFLSYEMAQEVEPRLVLPRAALPWRAFALRTPCALIHDRARQRVFAVAEADSADALDRLEADARLAAEEADAPDKGFRVKSIREEDPEAYLERVRRGKEYVAAGDIYQTNLSRPWHVEVEGDPDIAALYNRLCITNPAPFAALAQWRGAAIVSSSPERLVRVEGRRVDTRPIAGTRPRSRRPGDDVAEMAALVEHPKERAEHIMLIDLERNDLGRVCEAGTVRVDELMTIESYAHVHHIVSNVSGVLRSDVTPIEALRAVFPGGTITGVPKFRCMQIIAELEGVGRGAYTGSLGYLDRNGTMDLNILIRTMTLVGRQIEFRAGAGIVADSEPQRELGETRAKARGLLAAFEVA